MKLREHSYQGFPDMSDVEFLYQACTFAEVSTVVSGILNCPDLAGVCFEVKIPIWKFYGQQTQSRIGLSTLGL